MKEYKNYIFDLYGTLIDINCDERSSSLWRLLADQYGVYGCCWKKKEMRDRFFEMDREERILLSRKNGSSHPEIKLERVFARMLLEAPAYTESSVEIAGRTVEAWRKINADYPEEVLKLLSESDWMVATANLFRVKSRMYMKLFPHTMSTLKRLRKTGHGVYLLSNAQRIFTMPEIEQLELQNCFDRMYISSDAEIMKPDSAFMMKLLQEEQLDPEASVMVGNELRSDAGVAMGCGMNSIILNTAGRSKKELKKEREKLMKDEKYSSAPVPVIIWSGDIEEILPSDEKEKEGKKKEEGK